MTTFTPAVLITGHDERQNPFAFWKSINGWVDAYNECGTSIEFVRKHVFPHVQQAVIGPIVMTGAEWVEAGCPISLSDEQITAIEEAYRLEAATEQEAQAAEVGRDTQWLDSATVAESDWDFTPAQNMPIIDMQNRRNPVLVYQLPQGRFYTPRLRRGKDEKCHMK